MAPERPSVASNEKRSAQLMAARWALRGGAETQVDLTAIREQLDRDEETTVEVNRIGGESVDFGGRVRALDKSVRGPAARTAMRRRPRHDGRRTCTERAIDATRGRRSGRIGRPSLSGLIDANAQADGRGSNFDLGDRALLVGGEHPTIVVASRTTRPRRPRRPSRSARRSRDPRAGSTAALRA